MDVDAGSSLDDFVIIQLIGKGNFGSVRLVQSKKNHNLYALKEIIGKDNTSINEIKTVLREIKLLEKLDHPNIIKHYTSFSENDNFYILNEFIEGGNLEDFAKEKVIDEKLIYELLIQCLSALYYLHEKVNIIHRDIKPDNLLLDINNNIKITDFGISAIDRADATETVKFHGTKRGPLDFAAPEVLKGGKYNYKCDIYMLGLTFFYIMSKKMPEERIKFKNQIFDIKNPEAVLPNKYSTELRNFIKSFLASPEKRPTSKDAYFDIFTEYTKKYLKFTSMISFILCFFSLKRIKSFFQKEIDDYLPNPKESSSASGTLKECLEYASPKNFQFFELSIKCLFLRIFLTISIKKFDKSIEIDIIKFITLLLEYFRKELKYKKDLIILNDINTLENSIINRNIFFKLKISFECTECGKLLHDELISSFYINLFLESKDKNKIENKLEVSIIDLFKIRARKYLKNNDKSIICEHCNKKINNLNIYNKLCSTPRYLFLKFDYKKIDFKIIIQEYINIFYFVEKNEGSICNYKLMGAIFTEKNIDNTEKYVSFSRDEDEKTWNFFNGESIQKSNIAQLINHENLKFLIYSND